MRRFRAAALLLALALAACGSKVAGVSSGSEATGFGSVAAAGGVPSGTAPATTTSSSGVANPASSPSAGPVAVRGSAPGGRERTIPLALTLNARCATPGTVMHAKAVTVPKAIVSFTAYYERDNNYSPDIWFVPSAANATGTVTWTWTLRPDVPMGPALVKVVVARDGKGNLASATFNVARDC